MSTTDEQRQQPAVREFVSAFMDGLSWMLANPETIPDEWRRAAMDCAAMRLPAAPVDARSAEFLIWWHDHGRKICITSECAEYIFEAGRASTPFTTAEKAP